jgi:uncharacterized membrane protein YagU involved in acid resistance
MTYGQAVALDIAVGAVAGLVAAAAMEAFQVAAASQIEELESDEPATAKAADSLSHAATGKSLPEKTKKVASTAVHYMTGAIIGGVYGLIAGIAPVFTMGRGLVFAAAVWMLGDELAVPALGWAPRASDTPPENHAYGAASHAVFALTLDFVRRKLNEWISED